MAPPQPSLNNTDILTHVFRMMEAFKAFDSDNDGFITVEELGGIMSSLGYNPSRQEVEAMMRNGDTNADGLMSMEEFLEINTKELNADGLVGLLHAALPVLDVDGQEVITGEELFQVLSSMGSMGSVSLGQCMDIISSLDADGDGTVDVEDIRLIVQALL